MPALQGIVNSGNENRSRTANAQEPAPRTRPGRKQRAGCPSRLRASPSELRANRRYKGSRRGAQQQYCWYPLLLLTAFGCFGTIPRTTQSLQGLPGGIESAKIIVDYACGNVCGR